jgi:hypothetical protein
LVSLLKSNGLNAYGKKAMSTLELILKILLGLLILLAGRKIFWAVACTLGFLIGFVLAAVLFQTQSDMLRVGVALGAGLVGLLLALLIPKLTAAGVGFIAGCFVVPMILRQGELVQSTLPLILAGLIGGGLGMLLMTRAFNLALAALSAFIGAYLLTGVVRVFVSLGPTDFPIVLLMIFLFGLAIQMGLGQNRPRRNLAG